MIEIKIELDRNDIIKSLTASGHGGNDIKGKDIVCAGVSALIYSAHMALSSLIGKYAELEDDGHLFKLSVRSYDDRVIGELKGITIFLLKGLEALHNGYSDSIRLLIE